MIQSRSAHRRQILVVDDDTYLTQMLKLVLETRGYQVNVARSGEEAIEKASMYPDLILLDLVLPDIEGFALCQKFRQSASTNHIPIIILTAKGFPKDIVEGLYNGADDYLTKPFENEELVARMEAVLRRRQKVSPAHGIDAASEDIAEVRRIICENQIIPHFQPIFQLSPFKLAGLEVLTHPPCDSILVTPEVLFRSAIRGGVYAELELLSWRKALNMIQPHLEDEKIFLNCNPYLIEDKSPVEVKALFPGKSEFIKNVVLEITERSAIRDYKMFYRMLGHYRHYGFSFAVDDIGGGYASLESIVEIRPEVVKLGREIVADIADDKFKRSLVKNIIRFCNENRIMSIAEGIETKEELETAKGLGVDAVQGYYLFRPAVEIDMNHLRRKTCPVC